MSLEPLFGTETNPFVDDFDCNGWLASKPSKQQTDCCSEATKDMLRTLLINTAYNGLWLRRTPCLTPNALASSSRMY